MVRRSVVLLGIVVLGVLAFAAGAQGAISTQKWESVTCKENVDLPGPLPEKFGEAGKEVGFEFAAPLAASAQCLGSTGEKHFTQAAGHPNFGITDFKLTTTPHAGPFAAFSGFPTAFIKEIVVDTPEGLSVNPEALDQCTIEQIKAVACPPQSLVGVNYLTVAGQVPEPKESEPAEKECKKLAPTFPEGECIQARVALPVYNVVPFDGAPSMVGFNTAAGPTYIVGSLSPVDQHVTFTISDIHAPSSTSPPIIESRLVFFSAKGATNLNPTADGTYLTMPSNCAGGQTSVLHLLSQGPPFEASQTETQASYTTPTGASGCNAVPFNPDVAVNPTGPKNVDTPEPTTVDVGIPFDPEDEIANSYLKTATVLLPEGMGINPASGNGLQACTAAQFGYHTNNPIACPEAAKIGTVEVQAPGLPPNSIGGDVYVGEPLKNGPAVADTGEQFRIFIHAFSTRYGVNVRLIGKVFPDSATGQLTAIVDENPQATFTNFRLHFFGGTKGTLTSPPTCGPNTTKTILTPWSGQANATPSQSFALNGFPGGGNCPKTLAERPFTPGYSATVDNPKGGAYTPFRVNVARVDGQQEVKLINVTLPKGLTGKLAGIPYCSEDAINGARLLSGKAEQAAPSCSSASQIGTTTSGAGSGGAPLQLPGKVYLAGPLHGSTLSLAVITPAIAGPYDLGNVVVRVAVNVDPTTAQINAVSEPIPNVFGGVKLDIRSIKFDIDREKFMINPTNCSKQATAGTINGGGANPASQAAWSSYAVSYPYQASNCSKLGFTPKFHVRLTGPTTRAKNPQIRAILEAGKGQANIARTALTLPHSLFLDNSHIGTVCTRPQLASNSCPASSIYGFAEAKSPLLDKKLKGKVYLVPGGHELPDLVADLRGQVRIQLHGVISSKRGGLKTVFNETPDVPVTKFVLNMKGGDKSLLVNSTNTCKEKQRAVLNIKGQNGKKLVDNQYPLNIKGCGKGK
ncbi:MAG TPA: hypothetical protein VFJ57_10430 [Solirubrobacterales bacterium]|nr:hypothetical protein [Solirubrobacterales bacterium]